MRPQKNKLFLFLAGVAILSSSQASAQTAVTNEEFTGVVIVADQIANLSFLTVPRKRVGVEARESLTVRNTTAAALNAGTLEIKFPPELLVVSTSPAVHTMVGGTVTWQIPSLAPGATFSVDFRVQPTVTADLIVTSARFIVPGMSDEGFIMGGESVTVAGDVSGSITDDVGGAGDENGGTLPRTGGELGLLLAGVVVSLSVLWMRELRKTIS